MNRKIITLFLFALFACSLFAQQETVGFEYNQNFRHLDSLRTESGIWSMNYRTELPSNTRIGFSLGLDNVKFFEDDDTSQPMLKSGNQIFAQIEAVQILYYFYMKGAIQFYSIKGDAYETTSDYSEVKYRNNYKIFEFPLSAGFTIPTEYFNIFIGVNKTFLYGSNKKEILVNNSGTETSLGSDSRQTFKTDLNIGIEGSLIYHLSENMDIELDAVKYDDKDFSFKISIWGPLKKMR